MSELTLPSDSRIYRFQFCSIALGPGEVVGKNWTLLI
jgi:hypothetical protein